MSAAPPPAASPSVPAAVRPGFWRRWLIQPVVGLLTQGVTPDRVAATFAVGVTCSLFPFLGATALLNLGAGWWLRLNQPLLQILNQLLGPLQLLLILVYVRLGEWLWQADSHRFLVSDVVASFRDASFREFLAEFGWAGIHAFTAWSVTAPALVAITFYALRPVLRRVARRRQQAKVGATTASAA